MTAADGMARLQGYPLQEAWLFSGRHAILARILDWMQAGEPGAFVVTGPAGSGKSAVMGRIVALSHPAQRRVVLEHAPLEPGDPDPGIGTIDAAVHLRCMGAHDLAMVLADRLQLPAPESCWQLREAVYRLSHRTFVGTNIEYGPFFVHSDYEQRQQSATMWRYQLLDTLNPVTVLRATHALAQFDGVTETPSLQVLLRDHLDKQTDGAETPEPAEAPEPAEIPEGLEDLQIPDSEAHLWQRPWWILTVASHQEHGTLPELTHDLFWLIDRFYSRIAWPYAENDVGEELLGLLHDLMHSVDDFRWGWLLQESVRQRMNAILGSEILPPYWPNHDQPDSDEPES